MPVVMGLARTTVINGNVYLGGGFAMNDRDCYLVCKYDPVKDEWSTLPPAPVLEFGVGQLNGKLVIVGGWYKKKATSDVHVFEEDTQQWVKSIPPMPSGLAASIAVSHSSSLVVCGTPDDTSLASVFVYHSQSSQWHSTPPLSFCSAYSSGVIVNDTFYVAAFMECVIEQESHPSSPAVFSLPLSTLLDPMPLKAWQRIPDTPCHISHLAATGGCLLALGGLHNACDLKKAEERADNLTTAVHAFCPATSSWVKIGDLPDLRLWPAISTLSSGELFVAGGESPSDNHKSAFTGIIR